MREWICVVRPCQGSTEIQNGRHGSTSIFVWAQKLEKLVWSYFWNMTKHHHIPSNMGMCQWFLKMLPKCKMAARGQHKFFCGRKNSEKKSEIIHILQSHSLRYKDVQVIFLGFCWNSKWPPRITFNFFVGAKTQKLKVRNYSNFAITFPTIWRCAGEFFKILQKFKMAATDQLHFFVGAKTQKLKVRNYSNFTITFPTIWRCAGDCLKILLKFKMAAMDELYIFLWAQKLENLNQKKITFYNHITHHLEICRWFYWNLKQPPQVDFLNICDRKNS